MYYNSLSKTDKRTERSFGQVNQLTDYYYFNKNSHVPAGTSLSMASGLETASTVDSLGLSIAVNGLELSIAPPSRCVCGGAAGAIKVL